MTEQTKKKTRACRDTDYLFVSAYLRAKEPQLLSREKAERMLASSVQEAARILEGCGYADVLSVGLDRALNDRRTAVFDDLEAIAPKDGIVSLFRMRYDYHNAKTIVKAEAMGKDPSGLLLGGGRVDAQALKTAYETGEAGPAPQAVLEAMTAARDALSRSADPQLADLILDRAYFAEYHAAAAQVGSSFLMGYAALQADSANLRAAVKEGTPMGKKAKSFMDAGALVPDDVIVGIVKERLAEPDCEKGFILDGMPRTIAQGEALEQMGVDIDKVVNLIVPDEAITRRMSGRRVCAKCGASYHIVNKPSAKEGVCDRCGGELAIRKDDEPATVLDRLKAYHEQTEPLVEFYRQRGKLVEVPDQGSIEATTAFLLKLLEA